jgi:hypothetical protein
MVSGGRHPSEPTKPALQPGDMAYPFEFTNISYNRKTVTTRHVLTTRDNITGDQF